MSAPALVVPLLVVFAALMAVTVCRCRRHSHRGPRHRLHRPCPYHDRLRHLIRRNYP